MLTDFGAADARSAGISNVQRVPLGIEDTVHRYFGEMESDAKLLHVGHLCPDKGTPQLLEAFSRGKKERPELFKDVSLHLVGETAGPYSANQMDEAIRNLDLEEDVEVCGVLQGVGLEEKLAAGDALLFPTVAPYESFGMVMVEAMRAGLPILATDWRANSEVLGTPFGGLLIAPGGALSTNLLDGLSLMLKHRSRWRQWGELNRKRFEEAFRIEDTMAKLNGVISQT